MNELLEVVLLNEDGVPEGTALKKDVHSQQTPLHLAFSCHLIDSEGRVLVSRRALGKQTWPGVWTNSFCGHPQPNEPMEEALRRHAMHELGLEVTNLQLVLPDFRYRAVDASGIVENEVCPVFTATAVSHPEPNPHEVAQLEWTDPRSLAASVRSSPWAFSPWLVSQTQQMPLYAPASSEHAAGVDAA